MTDEEIDDLYKKALASTARVVERPLDVEPFDPNDPVWRYSDALIDLIERLRAAESQLDWIDAFVNPEDSERGTFEAVEAFYVSHLELATRSIKRAQEAEARAEAAEAGLERANAQCAHLLARADAAEARAQALDDACRRAHRELFLGGGSAESASAADSILSATID